MYFSAERFVEQVRMVDLSGSYKKVNPHWIQVSRTHRQHKLCHFYSLVASWAV